MSPSCLPSSYTSRACWPWWPPACTSGWRAPELASPPTRLQAFAVWDVATFLLNATLFVLIGLQLPVVVDDLTGQPLPELIGYAALVSATVIAARFAWLFTTPYILRALDRRPRQRERRGGGGGGGGGRPGRPARGGGGSHGPRGA